MNIKRVLITVSCRPIGSEVAVYFGRRGWQVTRIDNNFPATFFGAEGQPGGAWVWYSNATAGARP